MAVVPSRVRQGDPEDAGSELEDLWPQRLELREGYTRVAALSSLWARVRRSHSKVMRAGDQRRLLATAMMFSGVVLLWTVTPAAFHGGGSIPEDHAPHSATPSSGMHRAAWSPPPSSPLPLPSSPSLPLPLSSISSVPSSTLLLLPPSRSSPNSPQHPRPHPLLSHPLPSHPLPPLTPSPQRPPAHCPPPNLHPPEPHPSPPPPTEWILHRHRNCWWDGNVSGIARPHPTSIPEPTNDGVSPAALAGREQQKWTRQTGKPSRASLT